MSEPIHGDNKSLLKKIRLKKDIILRVSMIFFIVAYPLTYIGAKSGFMPLMALAIGVVAIGSLLAAFL
ncbi:MAG: hypothetical protein JJE17_04490 [Peptostreptococcaceae bacterium]|nr:hypothetical protein [Peptostreptococcaceae bacterium]